MRPRLAEHVGLHDRGVVRAGAYADLVLLDPDVIVDRATPDVATRTAIGHLSRSNPIHKLNPKAATRWRSALRSSATE